MFAQPQDLTADSPRAALFAPPSDFRASFDKARSDFLRILGETRETVKTASALVGENLLAADGLSLIEEAAVLRSSLKRLQDIAFGSDVPVDVGLSANRLNKTVKRLATAAEVYADLNRGFAELVSSLRDRYPGYGEGTYEKSVDALIAFSAWDKAVTCPEDYLNGSLVAPLVLDSIERGGPIKLLLFVCPPVDFSLLQSDTPESYFRISFTDSLLSRQRTDLTKLVTALTAAAIDVKLEVVIGDNDEERYIWPVIGDRCAVDVSKMAVRREALRQAAEEYLASPLERKKDDVRPPVIDRSALGVCSGAALESLSAAEEIYNVMTTTPGSYIDETDLEAEKQRMRQLWRPGDYYSGLPEPSDAQLEEIVARKFATYAAQGLIMQERDPNLILLQTERPALLRTKMLNAGREARGIQPIPALYMFEP